MFSRDQQKPNYKPPTKTSDGVNESTPFNVKTILPNAEALFKKNDNCNEVCWEVTLVERSGGRTEDDVGEINEFNTGLCFNLPTHYHAQVTGSKELLQAGYMLANSPIVIGPNDNNQLVLPLYKFKEADDIDLPFRGALISLHRTVQARLSVTQHKPKIYNNEPDQDEMQFYNQIHTRNFNQKRNRPAKQNHMW